ncbi:single-stranded DNA-binding protein [Sphingomonas sp. ABOLF]|uniref:single-stranded DNA-binding protein n=1 Tax=Sphingomonas sp. ABOLF TaxID=1985879 RepID=UPI000F7E681A|nr:single-stranded DNA-binding protein [Sphingomonas sp. ABOLF]RSV15666.1 single-stranded DNA-binding protein [Sphingomonas sp. ABOLF]
MQIANIAGNLGKDAELKTTQSGDDFCRFSVAVTTGWGDRKATTWWDVTRWGKGADKLAGFLKKGTKVAVSGEISTREHEGKTYLQIRADHVTLQGDAGGAGGQRSDGDRPQSSGTGNGGGGGSRGRQQSGGNQGGGFGGGFGDDDLEDDVPFATCDPAFDLPGSHRRRVL